MKWHPVSLDVNLIENLESINNNKKRNVNENEKQYANKDVCNVIIVASSNINLNLKDNRLIKVIEYQRDHINM